MRRPASGETQRLSVEILCLVDFDQDGIPALLRVAVLLRLDEAPPYLFADWARAVNPGMPVEPRNPAFRKHAFLAHLRLAAGHGQRPAVPQLFIAPTLAALPP